MNGVERRGTAGTREGKEAKDKGLMNVARHLSIRGRVQGVFYRGWAVETARGLGLAGWVRNRRDGTVEALVQGEEASVERFVALAYKGPRAANVDGIEAIEIEPKGGIDGFIQMPTC